MEKGAEAGIMAGVAGDKTDDAIERHCPLCKPRFCRAPWRAAVFGGDFCPRPAGGGGVRAQKLRRRRRGGV